MKQRRHLLASRLLLSLVAVSTALTAWADETIGSYTFQTDGDGNCLIQSINDWNGLADAVAAGNDCSGKSFKMTTDIGTAADPVVKALGKQTTAQKADRMRFAGTFDGGNHTLTIALNTQTDDWWQYQKGYCSPFAYVKGVTIRDLHVAGTVTATGQWASGLVGSSGYNSSDGACTIVNCRVSVAITANYVTSGSSYGNHGGFIGIAEGNATITNCCFDGKFLGKDYKYSAGFIGINKGATTLTNCLFNPSEINILNNNTEGACEFVHDLENGTHTLSSAYWVSHFGEVENSQGRRVYATEPNATLYDYTSVVAVDNNTYYIRTSCKEWVVLQAALTAGTDYTLTTNLEAGINDAALVVPAGKNVTLNLANATLDRALSLEEAQAGGSVIKVETGATLTINDGTITGGHNDGNGGGIYNAGTLTLNGTIVTGNIVKHDNAQGGGIYNTGTLTLNGATVTGNIGNTGKNKNGEGIGVYCADGSSFNVEGNVQIKENRNIYIPHSVITRDPQDVYLDGAAVISFSGALAGSASIGIASEGIFTSQLNGNAKLANFFSNVAGYYIYIDNDVAWLETIRSMSLANSANTISTDLANANGSTYSVTLADRTLFKDDEWNTLCLPFDLTLKGSILEGATAKTLTAATMTGTHIDLTFGQPVSRLTAGTPYIIKWASGDNIVNPTFTKVKISSTTGQTRSFDGGHIQFIGYYDAFNITPDDTDIYYLTSGSQLKCTGTSRTLKSCRAYFRFTEKQAGTKAFSFHLDFGDDNPTSVKSLPQTTRTDSWHSLDGRRLSGEPARRGIYVRNGKKVVLK